MATRSKKADGEWSAGWAPIVDAPLNKTMHDLILNYSSAVLLERVIPDFRDGLKPGARRLMFVMDKLARKQVKSARIVGEVMGKYHPRGDSGIYTALTTMVNQGTPPAIGVGNWGSIVGGSLVDSPAAMRYTEAHLSKYGQSFFSPSYANPTVCTRVPNFDHNFTEPLVLSSLLPNVLFNGASAIGIGVAVNLPSFSPPSVLTVMESVLRGEKPDLKWVARTLKFFEPWGGHFVKSKANLESMLEFLKSNKGSVLFDSEYEEFRDQKKLSIYGISPGVRVESLLAKIRLLPEVKYVSQSGKAREYQVQFDKGINYDQYDAAMAKIRKLLVSRQHYSVAVTERLPKGEGKNKLELNLISSDDYDVDFIILSVPQLILRWLKWRVQLEARSIQWRVDQAEIKLGSLRLRIEAASNLDVIKSALESKDPCRYLMKAMKWTGDQANDILDLQLRRLQRLDLDKLRAQVKEKLAYVKSLKQKDPKHEVLLFLEAARKAFVLKTNDRSMQYWELGPMKIEDSEVEAEEETTTEVDTE